jgi:hypothetical protein
MKKNYIFCFYKPLGMVGGDTNDFIKTTEFPNDADSLEIVCCYPFFWNKYRTNNSTCFPVGIIEIIVNLFSMIISGKPLEYSLFYSRDAIEYISRAKCDVLVVRGARIAYLNEFAISNKRILILADCLSRLYKDREAVAKNRLKQLYNKYISLGYRREEGILPSKFDKTVLFSRRDMRFVIHLNRLAGFSSRIVTVPLAVNDSFLTNVNQKVNNNVAVFGVHGASHNIHRLKKLIKHVDSLSHYKFLIIGSLRGVPRGLLEELRACSNISIIGYVNTDEELKIILSQCMYSFCVYPFRSGMQNSVLISIALQQHLIVSNNIRTELLVNKICTVDDLHLNCIKFDEIIYKGAGVLKSRRANWGAKMTAWSVRNESIFN